LLCEVSDAIQQLEEVHSNRIIAVYLRRIVSWKLPCIRCGYVD
jgi:hypothetical protein